MIKWTSILFLLLFALAGNFYYLDLFFGVSFIFGSIAVLMAIRLHGVAIGVLVALIAGLYTYYIWGHPYAMVIFTVEAVVVGLLLRYGIKSLIIADALYWLILGAPLVWIFYSQVMGMTNELALLILLKQPINAITNAIVATFLLLFLPWTLRERITTHTQHHIGITELFFSLLIATSFVSSVLILLYENRSALQTMETNIEYRLLTSSVEIERSINDLEMGVNIENIDSEFRAAIDNDNNKYIVLDKFDRLLTSNTDESVVAQFLHTGSEKQITEKLYQWLPSREGKPFMVWWKETYYFISTKPTKGNVGRLVLLKSAADLISEIRQQQIQSLSLLLLITVIGIVFAYFVSAWLNKAIVALSVQTRNLSARLRNNEELKWPRSYIKEFDDLSMQAEEMSTEMGLLIGKFVDEQELLETRVKISNETLDESFARSNAIIETAVEGILTMDEAGMIESFNPAAEKMFLRSEMEIIGMSFLQLINAGDEGEVLLEQLLSISHERASDRVIEIDAKRKSGETFCVEITVSEVLLKDRKIYTIFINDISERKKADRIKNEFVSNVSHELRTPLTSIRGAIGLMASEKLGEMPEQFKSMLTITLENTERLVRLINDILDIQKLEAGGLVFVLRPERLAPIVQQCVEQNIAYGEQFGVNVKLINLAEDVVIKTEPDRLNQVLTNLISNAVKFSPQGGDVTIMVSRLANNVRISVTDEGPGIHQGYHETIFDKFSQLDGSASRKNGGTGLGLNIAKSYITRMHGEIGLDSIEGDGTTFFVLIPIYKI